LDARTPPRPRPPMQTPKAAVRPRRVTRAVHVGPVQIGGGAPISVQSMTTSRRTTCRRCWPRSRGSPRPAPTSSAWPCPAPRTPRPSRPRRREPRPHRRGHPLQLPVRAPRHRGRRREGPHQPRQHREAGVGAGGAARRQGEGHPHPDRRQLRLARKGHPRQVRLPPARGPLRERHAPHRGVRPRGVRGRHHLREALGRLLHDPGLPLLAERTDYPLHLGVTESGSLQTGTIKSSIGIGRCWPTASATRSASRSRRTPSTRSRSGTRSSRASGSGAPASTSSRARRAAASPATSSRSSNEVEAA
jgi:(E)-4-hydroxy-3-methylbut-2-enyl-diphosphate synthase